MCTCNGAAFLREQLDSIAAQTVLPDELVVGDDVSNDGTVAILRDFAEQAPLPVRIECNRENLGPALNFGAASRRANGDYLFLSDQDDVWRADKIAVQLSAMRALEERHGSRAPLLVHCDLETVDRDLQSVAPSFMESQGIHHQDDALAVLLVQNFVTGCTIMVNRPLRELALPLPQDCIMHDWWFALVAAAAGHIGFAPEPLVRYRQHADNRIGAKTRRGRLSIGRQWRERWREDRRHIAETIRQAECLAERLSEAGAGGQAVLDTVRAYAGIRRSGPLSRVAILARHRIRRQSRHAGFVFHTSFL